MLGRAHCGRPGGADSGRDGAGAEDGGRSSIADSYGYRPRKGALDAVAACRQRCWEKDWVIDLDIRKFFDSRAVGPGGQGGRRPSHARAAVDHALRAAVAGRAHRDARRQDGRNGTREPPRVQRYQPVLANLFMHYAFDKWLEREFPAVEFERYADDAVVHCATERQARRGPRRAGGEDGRSRAATAPGQDQDRVLQGQEPARARLRGHVVHLPRLHVPRQEAPTRDGTARCSPRSCPRSARTPSRE